MTIRISKNSPLFGSSYSGAARAQAQPAGIRRQHQVMERQDPEPLAIVLAKLKETRPDATDRECAAAVWRAATNAFSSGERECMLSELGRDSVCARARNLWGHDVGFLQWALDHVDMAPDKIFALEQLAEASCRYGAEDEASRDFACKIATAATGSAQGDRLIKRIILHLRGEWMSVRNRSHPTLPPAALATALFDRLAHCCSLIVDGDTRQHAVGDCVDLLPQGFLDLGQALGLCRQMIVRDIGDDCRGRLLSTVLRDRGWSGSSPPSADLIREAAVFSFLVDPAGEAISPTTKQPFAYPACLLEPRRILQQHRPAGSAAAIVHLNTSLAWPLALMIEEFTGPAAHDWDAWLGVLRDGPAQPRGQAWVIRPKPEVT